MNTLTRSIRRSVAVLLTVVMAMGGVVAAVAPASAASPTATIAISPVPTKNGSTYEAAAGSTYTLTAQIKDANGAPQGTFNFTRAGVSLLGCAAVPVNDSGVATCQWAPTSAESAKSVNAGYTGNGLSNKTASSLSIRVVAAAPAEKLAPSVSVEASPASFAAGASTTLTASVAGSATRPTGTVTFSIGGNSIGSATVGSDGKATLTTGSALAAGGYTVTANYSGDADYKAGTASTSVTVNEVPQCAANGYYTVIGQPSISGTAGVGKTLTVNDPTIKPSADVRFEYRWYRDGVKIAGATARTYAVTPEDMGHSLVAYVDVFGPDCAGVATPTAPTAIVPVLACNMADGRGGGQSWGHSYGNQVSFSVDKYFVTGSEWATPYLDFSFRWLRDGEVITGATGSSYKWQPQDVGHTILGEITMSSRYCTGSKTLQGTPWVPTKAQSSVTLAASAASVDVTGSSTLTATVSGFDPFTGTVTFRDGQGNSVGTAQVDPATRKATLELTNLIATNTYTAVYEGDQAHEASTSASVTVKVNACASPTVASAPTLYGTWKVGQTLTVDSSATGWFPAGGTETYRWMRTDADGVATVIDETSTPQYTLTPEDLGYVVWVSVRYSTQYCTNGGGTATKLQADNGSRDYTVVAANMSGTATISGDAVVDGTLTAQPVAWTQNGVDFTYQWSVDGIAIEGATASTYAVRAQDLGSAISVAVTGTKHGYVSHTADASVASAVAASEFGEAPVVGIVGSGRVGETLTAYPDRAAWEPSADSLSYQWYVDGQPIPGATERTYIPTADQRGARVGVEITAHRAGYVDAEPLFAPEFLIWDFTASAPSEVHRPTVTLSGIAMPVGQIVVTHGDAVVGNTTVGEDGNWSLEVLGLAEGTYDLHVAMYPNPLLAQKLANGDVTVTASKLEWMERHLNANGGEIAGSTVHRDWEGAASAPGARTLEGWVFQREVLTHEGTQLVAATYYYVPEQKPAVVPADPTNEAHGELSGSLSRTGADAVPLAALALGFVLLGGVLIRSRRREG